MSSGIKTTVIVYDKDFLKGYLEQQLDPVYHIMADMHDLCLREDLDIPNREEIRERCRKVCLEILMERKEKLEKKISGENK